MRPLLSVAIATRNRDSTLLPSLTALSRYYSRLDVEVIVHDNSEHPIDPERLERSAQGLRLVYRHTRSRLSQAENYEAACALAQGEYLTMLGDDDSIAPGALELIGEMQAHRVEAAFAGFSAYYWPGVGQRLGGIGSSGGGALLVPGGPRDLRVSDLRSAAAECLASGGTSLAGLPRLYYGIVHVGLVERVRRLAGGLFPGPSPDMASAVALSLASDQLLVGNWPFFIAGNSAASAAGLGLRGAHAGEIEGHPWLPARTASEWEPRIPKFWSGPTIWAASAWSAAQRLGAEEALATHFGFARLYAQCLGFHPRYFVRTWRAFQAGAREMGALLSAVQAAEVLARAAGISAARVGGLIRRRLVGPSLGGKGCVVIEGVGSIEHATEIVAGTLLEQPALVR